MMIMIMMEMMMMMMMMMMMKIMIKKMMIGMVIPCRPMSRFALPSDHPVEIN